MSAHTFLIRSQMRSARLLERRGFVEVGLNAEGGHVAT